MIELLVDVAFVVYMFVAITAAFLNIVAMMRTETGLYHRPFGLPLAVVVGALWPVIAVAMIVKEVRAR